MGAPRGASFENPPRGGGRTGGQQSLSETSSRKTSRIPQRISCTGGTKSGDPSGGAAIGAVHDLRDCPRKRGEAPRTRGGLESYERTDGTKAQEKNDPLRGARRGKDGTNSIRRIGPHAATSTWKGRKEREKTYRKKRNKRERMVTLYS